MLVAKSSWRERHPEIKLIASGFEKKSRSPGRISRIRRSSCFPFFSNVWFQRNDRRTLSRCLSRFLAPKNASMLVNCYDQMKCWILRQEKSNTWRYSCWSMTAPWTCSATMTSELSPSVLIRVIVFLRIGYEILDRSIKWSSRTLLFHLDRLEMNNSFDH